mmetsp:Transcript_19117/g.23644  ORF Transcript_19117/g.23644 Transcript_19117/m.23644 type:complete len:102 (+) Transcript_19117:716-1021(+)
MPSMPADYSGDKNSLRLYAVEKFRQEQEAAKEAAKVAEELAAECKEWKWDDLPERFNDFKCYHGWHYFIFIGCILGMMIIICAFVFYCRQLKCCQRYCKCC